MVIWYLGFCIEIDVEQLGLHEFYWKCRVDGYPMYGPDACNTYKEAKKEALLAAKIHIQKQLFKPSLRQVKNPSSVKVFA
jgi:hypothetical protein